MSQNVLQPLKVFLAYEGEESINMRATDSDSSQRDLWAYRDPVDGAIILRGSILAPLGACNYKLFNDKFLNENCESSNFTTPYHMIMTLDHTRIVSTVGKEVAAACPLCIQEIFCVPGNTNVIVIHVIKSYYGGLSRIFIDLDEEEGEENPL